jgi:hypothetical protein
VIYVGIDPGNKGAIAAYWPGSKKLIVHDMPIYKAKKGRWLLDTYALLDLLEPPKDGQICCLLEQVWARPNEGVSGAFAFGRGYGNLETALAAKKIPTHEITPNSWKKHFGLSSDKGVSRRLATMRFPDHAELFRRVKDDGRAEAALIALYGQEKNLT